MANALDELKESMESAIADAENDIVKLEQQGQNMSNLKMVEEDVKRNLALAHSQWKVYRKNLRTYGRRQVEVQGAKVAMLTPEEKEAYRKYNKLGDINKLEGRLTAAMEKALANRSELFGSAHGEGEVLTNAEEDDALVEGGQLAAKEIWDKTDQHQDKSLENVKKASQSANESLEIADTIIRQQESQIELTEKIRSETQELSERYGISFSIMGTILRQIACDGCFQALFAVLILAIIAFLIVKYA
eukprot:TRINITY_DN28274_c0_g1_i3.p1 TRINITY_DN28274_c0_g1~~TRINITY_DN28274_c0_g1_i3.p1  ORF type:complete len:246 (+),score=74.39 TRINITY_DN28274_c0_g1_i3:42-779(+)